jgi:hypothetical protein
MYFQLVLEHRFMTITIFCIFLCVTQNASGQCNIPLSVSSGVVTAIAAGGAFSVALMSTGQVLVYFQ